MQSHPTPIPDFTKYSIKKKLLNYVWRLWHDIELYFDIAHACTTFDVPLIYRLHFTARCHNLYYYYLLHQMNVIIWLYFNLPGLLFSLANSTLNVFMIFPSMYFSFLHTAISVMEFQYITPDANHNFYWDFCIKLYCCMNYLSCVV